MTPIEERLLKKLKLELVKAGTDRFAIEAGSVQRLSVSFPAVTVTLPNSKWTLLRFSVATLFVVLLARVTRSVVPTSSIALAASLKVVGLNEMPATPVESVLLRSTENQTVPFIG